MRRALLLVLLGACTLPHPADVPTPDAPATTYSVGGVVTGMWPEAAVRLHLQSGDTTEDMTVGSNGDFAFQTGLLDGAHYQVAIATAPLDHACTIEAASGVVQGADAHTIHIDCRAVADVQLSAVSTWQFDPGAFEQTVPLSLLAQQTTIAVTAPGATAITVNGTTVASGVPSATMALSTPSTVVPIAVTIGGISHTYMLTLARGAAPIAQYAYIKPPSIDAGDQFGAAIAIEGDWLAVGAPGEDSDATTIDGEENNAAPNRGAVFLFHRTGAQWTFAHYVKASDPSLSGFGRSLALSDKYLVVGTNSDAVVVFDLDVASGSITQDQVLVGAHTESGDGFGASVGVVKDFVVVGAPFEDSNASGTNGDETDNSRTDSGAAYVFNRTTTWSQNSYLKAYASQAGEHFGASLTVELDSNGNPHGYVGGPGAGTTSAPGQGQVYEIIEDGAWVVWTPSTCCAGSHGLGTSIAANEPQNIIVIGSNEPSAPGVSVIGDILSGMFAGEIDPTTLVVGPVPTNPVGPLYGSAVAMTGSVIAVGAPSDPSSGLGIDPPYDTIRPESGAVYVFSAKTVGKAIQTAQTAYIKASNSRRLVPFGGVIATSADTLVVGSPNEESNATGVNGNQLDASLMDAGAVYVFH